MVIIDVLQLIAKMIGLSVRKSSFQIEDKSEIVKESRN